MRSVSGRPARNCWYAYRSGDGRLEDASAPTRGSALSKDFPVILLRVCNMTAPRSACLHAFAGISTTDDAVHRLVVADEARHQWGWNTSHPSAYTECAARVLRCCRAVPTQQ